MTTTDEAGLLRAVLLRPDDDLPRLVYADWLDENGEPERAEFVRVGVGLHNWEPPYSPWCPVCGWVFESCVDKSTHSTRWPSEMKRLDELRERERKLWATSKGLRPIQHPCQWFDVPGWACLADVGLTRIVWTLPDYSEAVADVSRGFVSEVRLPLAAFVGGPCDRPWGPPGTTCHKCDGTGTVEGVARRLFAAHPVERVTLTDRGPADLALYPAAAALNRRYGFAGDSAWWSRRDGAFNLATPASFSNPENQPHWLPPELFSRLSGGEKRAYAVPNNADSRALYFSTREAALAALSDACVALGRERANLTNGGAK